MGQDRNPDIRCWDEEQKNMLERQIAKVNQATRSLDYRFTETWMNEMQIAVLAGLVPLNQDSGIKSSKRSIRGGCQHVRNILYQAALVASYHNPVLMKLESRL